MAARVRDSKGQGGASLPTKKKRIGRWIRQSRHGGDRRHRGLVQQVKTAVTGL